METNEYVLEVLARDRLAEMRAKGELSHRLRTGGPAARPLRVALGHALIRLGERLQGVGDNRRSKHLLRPMREETINP